MKTQITLDGKEVKTIIAKALMISEDQVIPLRYNFAIEGLTTEEIEKRIHDLGVPMVDNHTQ